jgi:hypothetical protein
MARIRLLGCARWPGELKQQSSTLWDVVQECCLEDVEEASSLRQPSSAAYYLALCHYLQVNHMGAAINT